MTPEISGSNINRLSSTYSMAIYALVIANDS